MEPRPGAPYPQGADWDGRGTNFALYSGGATGVDVCLFDDDGDETRVALEESTGFVWHGYVPGVGPGRRYGFRVHGPFAPEYGLFFDPAKLLLDPYARAIEGEVRWGGGLGERGRDSASRVPRSVVVDTEFAWDDAARPATPWHETVIYETHVKGLTMRHPDVEPELRGTFAGAAHPAVVEHLRSLGVTAVELLPVHQFVHKRFLLDRGQRQFWGYDTIGFFAPHGEYSASGDDGSQVAEFRRMVQDLHAAGLEVILDVVFNHTGEGGTGDPLLCFRGIDNRTYYLQRADEDGRVTPYDYTGTGNTTNFAHPQVLRLIMDSLRYWAAEMGVDGFRFDLASAIGRDIDERNALDADTADWRQQNAFFDPRSSFFDVIAQDPVLSRVKLIAEPWDATGEGYQLGNYPPLWAEWNDRWRDNQRDWWRSVEGRLPELATRFAGSRDLFGDDGRQPFASVNFVTSHDGFTLADLVSYDGKHNEANQEDSGSNDNRSWNCGAEGPTDDAAVLALRARQRRNFLASLAFSQGVPMLLGGDELGRTQLGNNNAYCQDNEVSWLDWSLDDERRELLEFTRRVLALRREHPVLRRRRWLTGGAPNGSGAKDVVWLTPDGRELTDADWSSPWARALGVFLNGEEIQGRDTDGRRVVDARLLVLLNAWWEALPFVVPGEPLGDRWRLVLDTNDPAASARTFSAGERVPLAGRSLVLLEAS